METRKQVNINSEKLMVSETSWRMVEQEWRKGPWTPGEDNLLVDYVRMHGEGRWSSVAGCSGLRRSGKSCRLRWVNYLRPGLKKGHLTPQEEGIIIELHALWGNKWSTIARYLPGRTDNEIKNYWRTNFKKRETPSKNQEKRKHKDAFRRDQHQREVNAVINNCLLHYPKRDTVSESPQGPTSDPPHHNQSVMAQDVAPCWNTISEGGLWNEVLWNPSNDHPIQPLTEQSFS